jgi:hypothetical protein
MGKTGSIWHDQMAEKWSGKECTNCHKTIKKLRNKLFCVLCPHCSIVLDEINRPIYGLDLEK